MFGLDCARDLAGVVTPKMDALSMAVSAKRVVRTLFFRSSEVCWSFRNSRRPAMPRFDPAEFGRRLARLTPQELRQAEGLVADARKRAEVVLEIDARADVVGPASSCPRCDSDARIRWGANQNGRTAMALLGLRGYLVGAERHAACPDASSRPCGRAGARHGGGAAADVLPPRGRGAGCVASQHLALADGDHRRSEAGA